MQIQKQLLRKILYEKRAEISKNDVQSQKALCAHVKHLLGQLQCLSIGFYRPFRGEPDITEPLIQWQQHNSKRLLSVPIVDDAKKGLMHFSKWSMTGKLRKGAFGIEQPEEDHVELPELIFSPCVGVNRQGFRLGNGGGFYDRYLAQRKQLPIPVMTVAVAYEALISDQIHANQYDIPFDWIVTEKGIYNTQGDKREL